MRTLYRNGMFLTMDSHIPVADALLVQDDRILAAGRDYELEGLLGPGDRRIDLQGRTVIPGLIDAHTHFAQYSFGLTDVNLEGAASLEEALVRGMSAPHRMGVTWGVRATGAWPCIHLKH